MQKEIFNGEILNLIYTTHTSIRSFTFSEIIFQSISFDFEID